MEDRQNGLITRIAASACVQFLLLASAIAPAQDTATQARPGRTKASPTTPAKDQRPDGQNRLNYRQKASFRIPGKDSNGSFDVLADGRLIACDGEDIFIETEKQSHKFDRVGKVQKTPPGFLRVAPGGARAALGSRDSGRIIVFDPRHPANAKSFSIPDGS